MQVKLKTKHLHASAGGMSPAQQRDLKAVCYITNGDGNLLFMVMIIGFYWLLLWCLTIV